MSAIINRDAVIEAWLEDDYVPSADETNRMSNAGHECDRYLYLRRTDGEKAAPANQHLKAIFKRGRIAQQVIARQQMLDAGYELYEQEQRFAVTEKGQTLWRGHIDGVIRDPRKGQAAPVHVWEAKFINTHTWKAINTLEDMLKSPKPWIRGYPSQVMLYMLAKGTSEVGILQLNDSETWLPKFIDVPLDYAYAEELLQRGRRINEAVAAGVAPPPIDWCETCERCPMRAVCIPDAMGGANLQLWERPEFERTVAEWELAKAEFKAAEAAFRSLDRAVKAAALGQGDIVVGNYWITTTERAVKSYTVPERVDKILNVRPVSASEESAA